MYENYRQDCSKSFTWMKPNAHCDEKYCTYEQCFESSHCDCHPREYCAKKYGNVWEPVFKTKINCKIVDETFH